MTRFTPEQIDHLLDNVPDRPAAKDVPADFFERNEEAILRRCTPASAPHRIRRAAWAAAASVLLVVAVAICIKHMPQHPSDGSAAPVATASAPASPAVEVTDAADAELYQIIATFDADEVEEWKEIEESDIFLECL